MAFALLIIGALLLVSGVRNTQSTLFTLVQGDFASTNGKTSFIYWMAAILLIGAIGFIEKLKPISTALLALVIVVLVLKSGNSSGIGGGFFQQFTAALATQPPQTTASPLAYNNPLFPAPVPGLNPPGFNQPGSIINATPGGFVPATQPTLAQLGASSYTGLE